MAPTGDEAIEVSEGRGQRWEVPLVCQDYLNQLFRASPADDERLWFRLVAPTRRAPEELGCRPPPRASPGRPPWGRDLPASTGHLTTARPGGGCNSTEET